MIEKINGARSTLKDRHSMHVCGECPYLLGYSALKSCSLNIQAAQWSEFLPGSRVRVLAVFYWFVQVGMVNHQAKEEPILL